MKLTKEQHKILDSISYCSDWDGLTDEAIQTVLENQEKAEYFKTHKREFELDFIKIDKLEQENKELEDEIKECAKSLRLELRRTDNLTGENIILKQRLEKIENEIDEILSRPPSRNTGNEFLIEKMYIDILKKFKQILQKDKK